MVYEVHDPRDRDVRHVSHVCLGLGYLSTLVRLRQRTAALSKVLILQLSRTRELSWVLDVTVVR